MDQAHISGTAVIITGGLLHDGHAKTAHGLLRSGKRFKILGIIDERHAGSDASNFVEGIPEGIPVVKSIDDFMSALNNNETAGVQRSLAEVSELSENLSGSLADVGSRMLVVDSQREMLSDAKLRYKTLLSGVEDLDYAKAVTALSAEMLSLEAAQSSFAQISKLSLFNYM